MDYKECMKYIHDLGKFGMNFGLERTERILELLGNPHKQLKLIHVAGTNGKGSTTSMITSVLIEAGYKVGMYTSPFLEEFEERIQINRENISKEDLVKVVMEVKEIIPKVIEEGFHAPTEFEIITCVMFKYFSDKKIDFGVIEVGLGGRLDSTNVINPVVSVITSISHDHMNILGNDIRDIAKEKAGIIKEKTPLVLYPQVDQVKEVIEDIAKTKNSNIIYTQKEQVKVLDFVHGEHESYQIFERVEGGKKKIYELPLLGEHQIFNCNTAITTIEVLRDNFNVNVSDEHILKGIKKVKWIGRMEILKRNPFVIIDGAHNIDGIKALKQNIHKYFEYEKMILILGILADKQVDDMIEEICLEATEVVAVTPHSDRAELAVDLKNKIENHGVKTFALENYEEAYKYAHNKLGKKDILVVSGSLYMIGDMRKIIRKEQ